MTMESRDLHGYVLLLAALYFLHGINASIGALSVPCSFLSRSPSTPSRALLIQPAPLQ